MCTVTYIPLSNTNFILTSNRDETPLRKTKFPDIYFEKESKLLYPKDELAGGTWIGVSDQNRMVCLLNGGFEKHERKSYYKKSRGVIVKELLATNDSIKYIDKEDLVEVEPFTLILIEWDFNLKAYELVWDGNQKHFSKLKKEPKIWSSSPLYDKAMKKDRETWFDDLLLKNPTISKESILKFHHNSDLGTKTTAPVMDRLFLKTVSISCLEKTEKSISFSYKELHTGKEKEILF